MTHHIASYYTIPYHIISYVKLCHIISHHIMSCDITLYHFVSYHIWYNQLTINIHRFLHVASNSWPGSNCWSWRLPEIRTFESYGTRDSMKLVPFHEIIVICVTLNHIILYRMTCHHVSYYVTTLISHSIIWHYLYYSPMLFLMCEIFSH